MDNTVGSLTQLQKSLIIGSLLGDGYLRIVPGRKNAFLEVNHSFKAKEYVDWKYSILQNLCISSPKKRDGNEGRIAYRFFTRQHPEITELYQTFYKNGEKTIPKGIKFDPIILAVWFMDDGSKCRESDVYLNTQQFSINEQKTLLAYLRELGIKARLNKDKKYYRIRILKESIKDFNAIISPHIIPSMRYKLQKEIE
jgi:hypothetical protein